MTNYTGYESMDIILNGISKTGLTPENNEEAKMKMTDYEFEVKGYIKVTIKVEESEELYEKAQELALKKAKEEIDVEWLDNIGWDVYEEPLEMGD
jgi:hypothetical protein